MTVDPSPETINSWKDIATYLGNALNISCAVRTAQDWEHREGLKVYRSGNKVWAYRHDLDEFARSKTVPPKPVALPDPETTTTAAIDPAPPPPPPPPQPPAMRKALILSAAALAVALATFLVVANTVLWPAGTTLSEYSVIGDRLEVRYSNGQTAWTHKFPAETLPQEYNTIDSAYQRHGQFVDLDGDGVKEFLFAYIAANQSDFLYLFSSTGKLKWRVQLGHAVTSLRGSTILPYYRIRDFAVLSRPGSGGRRIAVNMHHNTAYPAATVLLDTAGRQVAEYWHPGWLFSIKAGDLDGDGVDELVLTGVNNSFSDENDGGATAVVLNSERVAGQAPAHSGDSRPFQNIEVGQEAAVLLFPRLPESPGDKVQFTWAHSGLITSQHLEIETVNSPVEAAGPRVHYQFDRNLKLTSVAPNSTTEDLLFKGLRSPQERAARALRTIENVTVLKNRYSSP